MIDRNSDNGVDAIIIASLLLASHKRGAIIKTNHEQSVIKN